MQMTVEVGNTKIRIRDLLRLMRSVVELDRLAGDPLDIGEWHNDCQRRSCYGWRTVRGALY